MPQAFPSLGPMLNDLMSSDPRTAQKKESFRRRSVNDLKAVRHHLKITPWTLGIGLSTLVIMVIAVISFTGFRADLATYPPLWGLYVLAAIAGYGQYVGYAISVNAACTTNLPALRTFELEVAESLTYAYTPESVGSLALTIRFLIKKGLHGAEASAACGLSAFVTTVMSGLLMIIAAFFAASTINENQLKADTPSSTWEIILGILVFAGAVTVLLKAPTLRKRVLAWFKKALKYLDTLMHQPARGLAIAGGELITMASQVGCLSLLLIAFHASPKIMALVVITQIAGLATSIVPIPGGLGAPEAILVAGLTAIGVRPEATVLAALSYRLFTYWLPPIPGAVALYNLYRTEQI